MALARQNSIVGLGKKTLVDLELIAKSRILSPVRYLIPFGRARVSAPPVPAISLRPLQILPHL